MKDLKAPKMPVRGTKSFAKDAEAFMEYMKKSVANCNRTAKELEK